MTAFAVNWDYRCPFARNAHEHLVAGLRHGAPWDVTFVAFSLSQVHVEEGHPPVWEDPTKAPVLMAMQAGIVVRDHQPDRWLDVHEALFAARHDEARDLREEAVVRDVIAGTGADPDAVFDAISDGWPLDTLRREHERSVADHHAFGVPTFIRDDKAVFIRLMSRPQGDGEVARKTVDRVLHVLDGFAELNEFKHTSIPR